VRLEDDPVLELSAFGRGEHLKPGTDGFHHPQAMQRQIPYVHLIARRPDHSQNLLHLAVLHEHQVPVGEQHSEQALFLGVVEGEHAGAVHVGERKGRLRVCCPVQAEKAERVVVGQQRQGVVPRQLHHSAQRMLPVLGLLMEGVHQQTAVARIRRPHCRRSGQPVRLRQVLEEFGPFDGVAVVDVDLLEQLDDLVADEVIAGVLVEGLPHEPHEAQQVEAVVVELELLLDEVHAGVVEGHHDVTHIVAIPSHCAQLLLLPQEAHH